MNEMNEVGMARLLKMKITRCEQCPYLDWVPDNGCSNHSGDSICVKKKGKIIDDVKFPAIPAWCPLPKARK